VPVLIIDDKFFASDEKPFAYGLELDVSGDRDLSFRKCKGFGCRRK
jgi:hypothetical protein